MSTFRRSIGLPVVARTTAEKVGDVKHLVVVDGHIRTLHVSGRKASSGLVDWSDILAFGDDAVMVRDAEVLRQPADEREARAVRGDLDMLDKRVLDDVGDEAGQLTDVDFDPADGAITALTVGHDVMPGSRLRSVGSYSVVVTAEETLDLTKLPPPTA